MNAVQMKGHFELDAEWCGCVKEENPDQPRVPLLLSRTG
jgi:hypothetical protein